MNFASFILGITAVIAFLLGLVVFLRGSDRSSNRSFAVFCVISALWLIATAWVHLLTDTQLASLLIRIVHLLSAFMMASFVSFIRVFPERFKQETTLSQYMLYVGAAIFGGIAALPDLIQQITIDENGIGIRFGWPLIVLGFYIAPLVIHVNLILINNILKLSGVARIQTIYVAFGAALAQLTIVSSTIIIPLISGTNVSAQWGALGFLWAAISIALAIAQYRLWDLGNIVRRTMAGLLAISLAVLFTWGAIWLLTIRFGLYVGDPIRSDILWVCIGSLIGLAIMPTYHGFRGLLARWLREENKRIGELWFALGDAIVHASADDEATLLPLLRETRMYFGAEHTVAYLRRNNGTYSLVGADDPDNTFRNLTGLADGDVLDFDIVQCLRISELAAPLDAAMITRFGTVTETNIVLDAMEHVGAVIVVPMQWDQQVIGFLAMGARQTRDMYMPADISLLETIAAQAAIAVKNSELRAAIIAEKERTEQVLAEMESGVVVVDAIGVIRLVNRAACVMLEQDMETLIGQTLTRLPRSLAGPLQDALLQEILISGQRVYLNWEERLRVAFSTFIIRDPAGQREGACIVFRDLSMEDTLQRVERETERLRFLRAVSAGLAHEIRNPLVAIRTFTELAPQRLDDPEFREEFLGVAQSEIRRLEELVTQFMTLARPAKAVRETLDLNAIILRGTRVISAYTEKNQVLLRTSIENDLPALKGDETRLFQALQNLLMNAVDATSPGGQIVVTAGQQCDNSGQQGVMISIWNSGSYISPEEREQVFEPFFTSKPKGTGLGLAICHTIVDEHGGTTTVESDIQNGTAFIIWLPITSFHEMATASVL